MTPPIHNGTRQPTANPLPSDVLCGRGGGTQQHQGNAYWRSLVVSNKRLYLTLPKKQKALVAKSIVHAVESQNPPGSFLQKGEDGLWHDIGHRRACEKTSQALREGAPVIRTEMRDEQSSGVGLGPVMRPGQILPNGLIALNYNGANTVDTHTQAVQGGVDGIISRGETDKKAKVNNGAATSYQGFPFMHQEVPQGQGGISEMAMAQAFQHFQARLQNPASTASLPPLHALPPTSVSQNPALASLPVIHTPASSKARLVGKPEQAASASLPMPKAATVHELAIQGQQKLPALPGPKATSPTISRSAGLSDSNAHASELSVTESHHKATPRQQKPSAPPKPHLTLTASQNPGQQYSTAVERAMKENEDLLLQARHNAAALAMAAREQEFRQIQNLQQQALLEQQAAGEHQKSAKDQSEEHSLLQQKAILEQQTREQQQALTQEHQTLLQQGFLGNEFATSSIELQQALLQQRQIVESDLAAAAARGRQQALLQQHEQQEKRVGPATQRQRELLQERAALERELAQAAAARGQHEMHFHPGLMGALSSIGQHQNSLAVPDVINMARSNMHPSITGGWNLDDPLLSQNNAYLGGLNSLNQEDLFNLRAFSSGVSGGNGVNALEDTRRKNVGSATDSSLTQMEKIWKERRQQLATVSEDLRRSVSEPVAGDVEGPPEGKRQCSLDFLARAAEIQMADQSRMTKKKDKKKSKINSRIWGDMKNASRKASDLTLGKTTKSLLDDDNELTLVTPAASTTSAKSTHTKKNAAPAVMTEQSTKTKPAKANQTLTDPPVANDKANINPTVTKKRKLSPSAHNEAKSTPREIKVARLPSSETTSTLSTELAELKDQHDRSLGQNQAAAVSKTDTQFGLLSASANDIIREAPPAKEPDLFRDVSELSFQRGEHTANEGEFDDPEDDD